MGNSPSVTPGERTPAAPSRDFDSNSQSSQVHRTPRGTIGKSICIRGELTGQEDLIVEGKVEGKIELSDHNLTIGSSGRVEAEIGAKKVIVEGEISGNIVAGEKVELTASGRVKGDIQAPRVVIADGAHFKGMVNMSEKKAASSQPSVSNMPQNKKNAESSSSKPEAPVAVKSA